MIAYLQLLKMPKVALDRKTGVWEQECIHETQPTQRIQLKLDPHVFLVAQSHWNPCRCKCTTNRVQQYSINDNRLHVMMQSTNPVTRPVYSNIFITPQELHLHIIHILLFLFSWNMQCSIVNLWFWMPQLKQFWIWILLLSSNIK